MPIRSHHRTRIARAAAGPWASVAVGLVFVVLAALAVRQAGSFDAGFHLKAGEYVLGGHGWPRTDPFSYTMADHPYVDTSWGYQVLAALAHRGLGVRGLVLLHAALVLTTFGLIYARMRPEPAARPAAAALVLLGVLAAELRFEVRPELLSYALLAWVLWLLDRHASGSGAPLALLAPTFLLWVNAHGLFVVGWIAVACFVAGLWLRDRRLDRRLLGWSAASAALCLVNPYGWRGLTFPLTLATRLRAENVFAETIGEFVSPLSLGLSQQFPFYPRSAILSFYVLLGLAVVSTIRLARSRDFAAIALVLPFAALAASAIRNVPLLVVGCLPGILRGLPLAVLRGESGPWAGRAVALAVIAASLVTAPRVVHDAHYVATRRLDRFGLGWNREALPVDAVEHANRAGLRGRVLNQLGFGGYLMWARDEPVFIDGRLEVVGERFYLEYLRVLDSEPALEAAVARHGIEWIIFPYKLAPGLLQRLSADPRWRLAYVDHLATIFVRSGTATARALHPSALRARLPPAEPRLDALPGLGGRPRLAGASRAWAGLVRPVRFPSESFGLGLFHYFRGEPLHAATRFAEAIATSDGAYYEIYANLGSALLRLGREDEARECYAVVLDERPDNELARRRLAETEGSPRRTADP